MIGRTPKENERNFEKVNAYGEREQKRAICQQ